MSQRSLSPNIFGVPLPTAFAILNGAVLIDHLTPSPQLWKSAYDLGVLLQKENGDKNPPLPDNPTELAVDAWLWADNGRAVAVLAAQAQDEFLWLSEVDAGAFKNWQPLRGGQRIICVWTAKHFRRRGIAKNLAIEAARHFGMSPTDFIHTTPLSQTGRKFAKNLTGGPVRVV